MAYVVELSSNYMYVPTKKSNRLIPKYQNLTILVVGVKKSFYFSQITFVVSLCILFLCL